MSQIDDLQMLLKRLPGIGPRQARRFVYFLLASDQAYIQKVISSLQQLRSEKHICAFCRRLYFTATDNELCPTCSDVSRDLDRVLVVEKNSDFENFNSAGVWGGRYFLIFKSLGILEDNPDERLGLTKIIDQIEHGAIKEIVIALSVNPEGEFTTQYLKNKLKPYVESHGLVLSTLARGLSTGSEIEYADSDTLRLALENRK